MDVVESFFALERTPIQRNRRRHFPYHADIRRSPSIKLRDPLYDPLRSISPARCFRLYLFVILREPSSADPLRNWDFLRQIHIAPSSLRLGSIHPNSRELLWLQKNDLNPFVRRHGYLVTDDQSREWGGACVLDCDPLRVCCRLCPSRQQSTLRLDHLGPWVVGDADLLVYTQ